MNTLNKVRKLFVLCFFIIGNFNAENQNYDPIFTVSIPKSGTTMLEKCITLITGFPKVNGSSLTSLNNLKKLKKNIYLGTHAIASDENIQIVNKYNAKGIFIYRDFRDQIVSTMHYIYNTNNWPQLKKLTYDELITYIINHGDLFYGVNRGWFEPKIKNLGGCNEFYESYLPWINVEGVYVTTYEKLVGSNGGGSDSVQFEEIKNICMHLNYQLDDASIVQIQQRLYGGTHTFRSGKIGEWKKYFSEEHKAMVKSMAGQLLIDHCYESDFEW